MLAEMDCCQIAGIAGVAVLALIVVCALIGASEANDRSKESARIAGADVARREAAVAEQEQAIGQRRRQAEREIADAIAKAKADVMANLSGLAQIPPEARLVHLLQGYQMTVRFSLARRDGTAWVGIAWAVHPEVTERFVVQVHRKEGLLHRDASRDNLYAEPLTPGRHRYEIRLINSTFTYEERLLERLEYVLPIISEEEVVAAVTPEPAPASPPPPDPQAERDRRLREAFRAVVNRLMTVTDLKQECCKEIKGKNYAPDDEEWMLNQVERARPVRDR